MDWSTTVMAVTSLIGVIFSGGISLIICLINQNNTRNLIEYRLSELEKKVDKHNNIIERTYKLEERVAVLESDNGER